MKRLPVCSLALALAGTVALAACGGDDDAPAASDTTESVTGPTGTEAAAPATTRAAPVETSAAAGDGELAEWCALEDVADEAGAMFDAASDADDIREAVDATRDFAAEAAEKAPDEIEADVETLMGGFLAMADGLENVDYDPAQIETVLQTVSEDEQALDAASQRIGDFNDEHCDSSDG